MFDEAYFALALEKTRSLIVQTTLRTNDPFSFSKSLGLLLQPVESVQFVEQEIMPVFELIETRTVRIPTHRFDRDSLRQAAAPPDTKDQEESDWLRWIPLIVICFCNRLAQKCASDDTFLLCLHRLWSQSSPCC